MKESTIADICARAEISRPTFYLHYEDVYALLDEIGENLIASANLTEISELELSDQDSIHRIILHLVRIVEKKHRLLPRLRTRTPHRDPPSQTDHRRTQQNHHQKMGGQRHTRRFPRQAIYHRLYTGGI